MRHYTFTPDERPTMSAFNQRFKDIEEMANGLGNEYVWEKTKIYQVEKYKESEGSSFTDYRIYDSSAYSNYCGNYKYSNAVQVNSNGEISLVNPQTLSSGSVGTPVYVQKNGESEIRKLLEKSGSGTAPNYTSYSMYNGVLVTTVKETVDEVLSYGYVNSLDKNAYPPAEPDGYTYTALGQFGAKVQIATGSYTGTGTYGSSNPNSLTFDFVPKLVFIANKAGSPYSSPYLWGNDRFYSAESSNDVMNTVSVQNKSMSWYSINSAQYQLNMGNVTYNYIAIG